MDRLRRAEAQRGQPSGEPRTQYDFESSGRKLPTNKGTGGIIAIGALLLWKFKFVLLFVLTKLKVAWVGVKLLKFGKLMTTGWTMILSMWLYSMHFGAPFAIGMVLLILVHELGHGLAAKLTGLPVGAPVFIPFLGAVIALKEAPRDTFQDFVISIGGPLAGTLGGLACLALAPQLGEYWGDLFYVLAFFTLLMNLFNLTPIWRLDGMGITAPFRVGMWALAVLLLGATLFWASGNTGELNPLALIVVLVGGFQVWRAWSARRGAARAGGKSALKQLSEAGRRRSEARDLNVSDRQRWIAWGSYVTLTGTLIVLVHTLYQGLPVIRE
ncbi:MAG: hypothetical protein DHS20C15_31200 [Planctomycetota bacterium]|nr:MAG: hypothetical protein DHS20C15_31200 [Planctomycetota bacterium]